LKVKLMMMAYDKNGVIATDRVPPGSTLTAAYNVCPKSNENDFFCAVQKGQERKVGVKAGGEETQVYSLTFLS
jgi:hypothetical protein